MVAISRRAAVVSVAVTPALRRWSVPLSALALAAPRQAHAWAPVAIAVVSTVASMVMAHNRGDGGLSAALQATLGYLRVISDQLDGMQSALGSILTQLDQLPERWRKALRDESINVLRTGLVAGGTEFAYEAKQRASQFAQHGGYDAWVRDANTMSALRHVDLQLRSARATMEARRIVDAVSIIFLAQTTSAALATRAALNEKLGVTRAIGQEFLNCYDLAQDVKVAGSVAAERQRCLDRLTALQSELKTKYGLVLPTAETTELIGRWLLSGVTTVEQRIEKRRGFCRGSHSLDGPVEECQHWDELITGAKVQVVLASSIKATFVRVGDAVGGYELKQFSLANEVVPVSLDEVTEQIGDVPVLPNFAVGFVGKAEKLAAIKASNVFTDATKRNGALQDLLDGENGINVNLAQLAICAMADDVIANSRDKLFTYFGGPA